MNCKKTDVLLYAVTDRRWLNGGELSAQVEAALKGGATFVQLREKQLEPAQILEEARKIKAVCAAYGVPFVMNDSVEIALAVDADGVHIGQKDMDAAEARRRIGPHKILGVSARSAEQAKEAQRSGADYLGAGAVFATGTKADAKNLSHQTLREICRAVSIPVVAIGGITEENVPELCGSGVSGIAVVSALFARPDVEDAARRLRRLSEAVVYGKTGI